MLGSYFCKCILLLQHLFKKERILFLKLYLKSTCSTFTYNSNEVPGSRENNFSPTFGSTELRFEYKIKTSISQDLHASLFAHRWSTGKINENVNTSRERILNPFERFLRMRFVAILFLLVNRERYQRSDCV